MKQKRIIFHIDMDAFFTAVEERSNPHLRGRPVVVGADPKNGKGRGVVSTANYEARKYGIRSAMPISEAWRRCPQAVFLPVDHELYSRVSEDIATLIRAKLSDKMIMEQASIDEFYIEARDLSWEDAIEFAKTCKSVIFEKERLACSMGAGPNPLVAKIASDYKKPDGLTLVKSEEVMDFLALLPVRKIPGIGPKTEEILAAKNVKTISDLRRMTLSELVEKFGKWGEGIYDRARGIDDSPIGTEKAPKSIGEQETFEHDTHDRVFLIERLMTLCDDVWRRMLEVHVESRTIVITIRFADFETKTRSRTLTAAIPSLNAFKQEVLVLAMPFLDRRENPHRKAVRLLGIRGEKLSAVK